MNFKKWIIHGRNYLIFKILLIATDYWHFDKILFLLIDNSFTELIITQFRPLTTLIKKGLL